MHNLGKPDMAAKKHSATMRNNVQTGGPRGLGLAGRWQFGPEE